MVFMCSYPEGPNDLIFSMLAPAEHRTLPLQPRALGNIGFPNGTLSDRMTQGNRIQYSVLR